MKPPPPTPDDFQQPPAPADGLLEQLAGLTGLFNPEVIWQKEMQLDELSDAEQEQPHDETPPDC